MSIYRIEIPSTSEGVLPHIHPYFTYFESNTCPTQKQIAKGLENVHQEHLSLSRSYPEQYRYQGLFLKLAQSVVSVPSDQFPILEQGQLSASVVLSEGIGERQTIVVTQLQPIKV
jgi:hypothetical protein